MAQVLSCSSTFPGGQGAADYCFSFEFLEAILNEFGTSCYGISELLKRVEQAVQWCDRHELVFTNATGTSIAVGMRVEKYESSKQGCRSHGRQPAVHMFLTILEQRIDDVLDELILKRFGLDRGAVVDPDPKKFEDLIDVEVKFPFETPSTTLKTVLQDEMLKEANKLNCEELRPLAFFGTSVGVVVRSSRHIEEPTCKSDRRIPRLAINCGYTLRVPR